jgi:hypothetical protein
LLDKLAAIETTAVEQLGEREFSGRKLLGFALPAKAILDGRMRGHVWVDPQSRLPVRYEVLPADPTSVARRWWRYVGTFTFNRPLEQGLFELTVPESYAAVSEPVDPPYIDQFPAPPVDEKLASPIIEPNVGIGPARFGMTVEEVITALGRPTAVNEYWEPTQEEQQERATLAKKAAAEADEKGLTGRERALYISQAMRGQRTKAPDGPPAGISLDYHSRGITLTVSNEQA